MNRKQRIFHTIRIMLIPSAGKRVAYMKKHKLFGEMGENVHIQGRVLPLHSNLIHIHDDVKIASNVTFLTHDIIHKMLNCKMDTDRFIERVGCIEIMDHVFIGAGSQIMYNVRIGSNVIIAAGSIVTKDIPDNSVYAGVPARYICSFDEYLKKAETYSEHFMDTYGAEALRPGSGVSQELAQKLYADFQKQKAAASQEHAE